MKDSDAKKPVFKAQWFIDRASSKTMGKGMGVALADWEAWCTDPSEFETEKEFNSARQTIAKLRVAIKKADDECNKLLQKSTKLCLRNYTTLVLGYEKQLELSYEMWEMSEKKREKEEQEQEEEEARNDALSKEDVALIKKYFELTWPDISESQAKSAWKKFSLKYHPDRTGGDVAKQEIFKTVSAAYDHLKVAVGFV